MRFKRPTLRFVLDESVPNAVGTVLEEAKHKVLYVNKGNVVPRGSKDEVVSAFAMMNGAILVATDGDMKTIAKKHGVTVTRYARLSLLKLSCLEPDAAERVKAAMTLIEHEWHVSSAAEGRRLFVEIGTAMIKTNR